MGLFADILEKMKNKKPDDDFNTIIAEAQEEENEKSSETARELGLYDTDSEPTLEEALAEEMGFDERQFVQKVEVLPISTKEKDETTKMQEEEETR